MPYWIEQTEGKIVDQIRSTLGKYREGTYSLRKAFSEMFLLYEQIHNRVPFDYHGGEHTCYLSQGTSQKAHTNPLTAFECELLRNGGELQGIPHMEYLVVTWFPAYINMFFGDHSEGRCYYEVKNLEQANPGEKFAVAYEY